MTQFSETARFRGWDLHAAAIMRNHVHVVLGVLGSLNQQGACAPRSPCDSKWRSSSCHCRREASRSKSSASLPGTAGGWNLVWSDDFTGAAGTGVNTANWLYDLGHCYPGCPADNWGTGEIENMTDSTANVYHDGSGNLAIKPIRDSAGTWTSGRIETQRTDFAAPAGGRLRIEGRIQMPNVTGAAAQGYWPAFWTLGAPFRGVYTNWPSAGEIDLMENVNGANTVYGTLHCGTSPGGPCNETTGLGGSTTCPGATCQSAFHTYAVEFDRGVSPEQIRWYVDGVNYHTVRADQVDATTWRNATDHGFFVNLNVAIGGGWPGAPTSATVSGVPMLVDYVAVYTTGSGSVTTATPTTTRPTTTTPTTTTTTSTGPVTGSTLYLRTGNTLSSSPGTAARTDTVASAGGVNSDGTPRNPTVYQTCGITGTPDRSSTTFSLRVDAGTAVGNGVQDGFELVAFGQLALFGSDAAGDFFEFLCRHFLAVWAPTTLTDVKYAHIYRRDAFKCSSPVCERHDVQPHHLKFRSAGGGEDDENLTSLCTWCHLEGVHGGRIRVAPPASRMRWDLGRGFIEVHGREVLFTSAARDDRRGSRGGCDRGAP